MQTNPPTPTPVHQPSPLPVNTEDQPENDYEAKNRELYRVKASWLVDIFPDEMIIREKTVSVIHNDLLSSEEETLPVRDVGRVVYVDTPFFAGLQVIGKNTIHELKIKGLYKKQAIKAREIINGLLLQEKGVVEIPEWLEIEERRRRLREVGQTYPRP